jgi:dTDP-4-dehydrorhamnose 3,5-epimerase
MEKFLEIRELDIQGLWIIKFPIYTDSRGDFREWFKASDIESQVGKSFETLQANISSSKKGALRGIHFSLAPGGQGKLITCATGSIWDVVVDLRVNYPTFKRWVVTPLDSASGESLYVSDGLGHGFVSMSENSKIVYLLTGPYSKEDEYEVNPFDPEIGIKWPIENPILSTKDSQAPSLLTLQRDGKLPLFKL